MKSKFRPKLLVIGSGFHKHILGKQVSPLACWCTLLKQVALTKKLDVSRLDLSQPTLAWESMVTALVEKDKKRELAAYRAENELRKTAVEILARDAHKYQDIYRNNPLVDSIAKFHGHILNLNFDHLLDQLLGISVRVNSIPTLSNLPTAHAGRKRDSAGLYRRWLSMKGDSDCPVTVWHPHGTILKKDSLRLGLRDYGFQPTLFAGAFACFKAWERKILETRTDDQPFTEKQYLALIENAISLDDGVAYSHQGEITKHDNWVTRFMLFDIFIIGASISQSETGLRWLFVQRQRNFARIKPPSIRPKTVFFDVKENHPFGLMDYEISASWDHAWHKVLS